MDEILKRVVSQKTPDDERFIHETKVCERYYVTDNDIMHPELLPKPKLAYTDGKRTKSKSPKDPFRNADYRVASGFLPFLIDQKVLFLLGHAVKFNTDSDELNQRILAELGGHWHKTGKDLGVNASCAGVAYLYCWTDAEHGFHYKPLDPKTVKIGWSDTLEHELEYFYRIYESYDYKEGKMYEYLEVCDKQYIYEYRKEKGKDVDFEKNLVFTRYDVDTDSYVEEHIREHGFSKVPLAVFYNNSTKTNDLKKIKGFIDIYDMTFSCFADDIEDASETVLLFKNVPNTSLSELKNSIREEGAMHIISNEYTETGVETLSIEVPVTARKELLDLCENEIYRNGQGVKLEPERLTGNASGEALKYMYANLEQKAANMKDEFIIGFDYFMSLLLEYLGISDTKVKQIWTETRINNETEIITNIKNSVGILSQETLINNHPFVDDGEEEKKRIEKEQEKETARTGGYDLSNFT